jgi:hypothetical protein
VLDIFETDGCDSKEWRELARIANLRQQGIIQTVDHIAQASGNTSEPRVEIWREIFSY